MSFIRPPSLRSASYFDITGVLPILSRASLWKDLFITMPFLYDPKYDNFDVGDSAASWSHPGSRPSAESNTLRATPNNDSQIRMSPRGSPTAHIQSGDPVGASPDSSFTSPGRDPARRSSLDVRYATSHHPSRVIPLTASSPWFSSSEGAESWRSHFTPLPPLNEEEQPLAQEIRRIWAELLEPLRARREERLAQLQADEAHLETIRLQNDSRNDADDRE